ncbi:hypothetical protein M422DRAFT_38493 [Sphaerobolus stellatus SS14]|uniref:Uncharacterized protein n=1 Tax=Sphaerobolus stellatus (strain SS14) TaxID=990650 RepID=A0A0C9TVC8_SPHS4|nr:hypothetical protein M422DRAFT_38493 [Sphaerobolus stellatus SS14]
MDDCTGIIKITVFIFIWLGNAFLWLAPRLVREMEVNHAYPDSALPIPNFYAAA